MLFTLLLFLSLKNTALLSCFQLNPLSTPSPFKILPSFPSFPAAVSHEGAELLGLGPEVDAGDLVEVGGEGEAAQGGLGQDRLLLLLLLGWKEGVRENVMLLQYFKPAKSAIERY